MAQSVKFIDLTRSFVPVNPNSYPENLMGTNRGDYPEDAAPIVAYEGHNFMPTAYGYKSYFGTNTKLGIDALTSRCDYVFMYRNAKFENILVALCEDGIWTKRGEEAGAWNHVVTLSIPETGTALDWSYAVLANDLYMYRATNDKYYKLAQVVSDDFLDVLPSLGTITPSLALGNASILPAGNYKYAVAYKSIKNGWYSAPTAFVAIDVLATRPVLLEWPKHVDAESYRIYRQSAAGDVSYYDAVAVNIDTQQYYDLGEAPLGTLAAMPDSSWLSNEDIDISDPVAITPNFLNMEGQQGLFSAGTRLGFWDSANSVSWSSIDDYADFTPSIQTLAGSAIFSDVAGRIVTILGSGEGFTIYATQSIVKVSRNVEATFQWEPAILLNAGISYPKQAAVAIPGTTHYAYTSIGIYQIDKGQIEQIIPQVYDYLKEANSPIYLTVLEGRYLAFCLMDQDFVIGQVSFNTNTIPAQVVTFPSTVVVSDLGDPITVEGSAACYTLQGTDAVHNNSGAASVNGSGQGFTFSPLWKALYKAYYSYGGVANTITYDATPCPTADVDGNELNFNPQQGTLDSVTQNDTNKYVVQDSPSDLAYKLNSEKFVATQLALWRKADEARAAMLAEIQSKTYTGTKVVSSLVKDFPNEVGDHGYFNPATNTCPIGGAPIDQTLYSDCLVGEYILEFSPPTWGISSCGLSLTRYATKKATLWRRTTTHNYCARETLPNGAGYGWHDVGNGAGYGHTTPLDVLLARIAFVGTYPAYDPAKYRYTAVSSLQGKWELLGGDLQWTAICHPRLFMPGKTEQRTAITHTLEFTDIQTGVFAVDTAYMEISGWYNSANPTQIVPASITCAPPVVDINDPVSPSVLTGSKFPVDDTSGTICGIPFQPITIPAIQADPIDWPSQSVILPPSTFLMQKGSIAPIYPTFYGALIYDLQLKKWGKYKGEYKQLLDYNPLNGLVGNNIPYSVFGIKAGILSEHGDICLFDESPIDSVIKYGKIGYDRKGFTDCEEVRIQFKAASTAKIAVEGSLDGRFVEATLVKTLNVDEAMSGILFAGLSGRWYNIRISGQYDISYLEFRGYVTGRR